MKKKSSLIFFLLLISNINLFACCCEAMIQQKTQQLDEFLKTKNDNNTDSLDKMLSKLKELNTEIIEDRNSKLDDTSLISSLSKHNINNAKNLYHANSIPLGLSYFQMKKDEFVKDELIDAVSNQIDINSNYNQINFENSKNRLYYLNRYIEQNVDYDTQGLFGIKTEK